MQVNKFHIILLLFLLCCSCIDPYEPLVEETQEVMVIEGFITDRPGIHTVRVSRSTPYNHPAYNPVQACVVAVEDEMGNIEVYGAGSGDGVYSAWLDEPFLGVGKSYSLHVQLPGGKVYRSDYDTLLACPPVDRIYYEVISKLDADPEKSYHGIQFYNDVKGPEGGSGNYRWKLTETWEYSAPYTSDYIWKAGGFYSLLEDTVSTCYLTEPIRAVYAASTDLLRENTLIKNRLNYVSNQSPRLVKRYSLLVEQQSLSEQAFRYWNELKVQSDQSGGLYETQPSGVIGNISGTYPGERVLGCFYATQIQEKRMFVEEEFDFNIAAYTCVLDTILNFNSFVIDNYYYLFSLAEIPPGPPWLTGSKRCFDCTLYGGENEKPDFW